MPKDEWGLKRQCGACGARFYDLGRDPVDCPKCGETYSPAAAIAKGKVTKDTAKKSAADADLDDDDLVVDDEDDDTVPLTTADADDKADIIDADADGDSADEADEPDLGDDVLLDDDEDDDDDLGDFAVDDDAEDKDR